MAVPNKIIIKKNGRLIAEIPMSDFPVDVSGMFLNGEMDWKERHFTWKLSYHRDEKTWQKFLDRPKGTQLEVIAVLGLLSVIEKILILSIW